MDDIDLSEIDPLKWAETRRRVAAIREYLALPHAGIGDRERIAASLDLGAHQFANLVKAWQASKEATAVSPGSRRPDRPSRSKSGGVDPLAREIARAQIAMADPVETLDGLLRSVTAACAAAKVEPPSRGTVWLLAREIGWPERHAETASGIVVGRAFLRLPVDIGASIVLPEVAFAVDAASARILAATSPGPGSPEVRQLASALGIACGEPTMRIEVDERDVGPLAGALPTGTCVDAIPGSRASILIARALGTRLGRLDLAYRRPAIRPAALMQSGRDQAPGLDDAAAALFIACRSHNANVLPAAERVRGGRPAVLVEPRSRPSPQAST